MSAQERLESSGTTVVSSSTADTDVGSPVHLLVHSGHSVLYVAMTSTLYTVVCLVIIAVLLSLLLVLCYCYYCRVRREYKLSKETVKYSPVSCSDQSEDERGSVRNKPAGQVAGGGGGRGYDAAPSYASSSQGIEPVTPYADASSGHLLLSYIEENLKHQSKLQKEWESLQSYTPCNVSTAAASEPLNAAKNSYRDAVPYDHNRVKLNRDNSKDGRDYINASFIVDADPKKPKYIAAAGPREATIADFWQMVWEQNVAVIVMLTEEMDMGLLQSARYWPRSGVVTYHNYEVRFVSEHPHSADYVVRSLYVMHKKTKESRTITHFQFLGWRVSSAPITAQPLLEFRRKVNKAHQSWEQTPLLIHCSEGVKRTGTYILIDMCLSKIQRGAKEFNLAASVEYLRDNRPGMVQPKAQFDFALAAIVEETHAMLNAGQKH